MKFNEAVLVVGSDPGVCMLIEPGEEWTLEELRQSFDAGGDDLACIPIGEPTSFINKLEIVNNMIDNVANHGRDYYKGILRTLELGV